MSLLIEKTKSQRKTFTIPNYIVKDLEEYAKDFGKKQSQIIAIALEEYLKKVSKKNIVKARMNALKNLLNIASSGTLLNLDMNEIKRLRALSE